MSDELRELREAAVKSLRQALAGTYAPGETHPTSGWWRVHIGKVPDGCHRVASFGTAQDVQPDWTVEDAEIHVIAEECDYAMPAEDDAAFVAAADPVTVAALLAERDALAARLSAAERDGRRLDVLEEAANQKGGLLLHDGSEKGRIGLGLRPGSANRTLRQAIDAYAGFAIDTAIAATQEGRS